MTVAVGKDRPAVLLDRDGTIVVERHYLSDPAQVELLPGVSQGLQQLALAGFRLIVVTNQSGIARGYFDWNRLTQIHERMRDLLAADGVALDGVYVCPHAPVDDCECRKPRSGLVNAAALELGFDPAQAWVIGDKPCDIDLGRGVGAKTILLRTGYGAVHEAEGLIQPDHVADDMIGAAEMILTLVRAGRPTGSG